MRISDWSSDVCSSDLGQRGGDRKGDAVLHGDDAWLDQAKAMLHVEIPFDLDSAILAGSQIGVDMRRSGTNIAGVDRPWLGRRIVLLHLAEEDLLEICHFGLWNLSHRRFNVAVLDRKSEV